MQSAVVKHVDPASMSFVKRLPLASTPMQRFEHTRYFFQYDTKRHIKMDSYHKPPHASVNNYGVIGIRAGGADARGIFSPLTTK